MIKWVKSSFVINVSYIKSVIEITNKQGKIK